MGGGPRTPSGGGQLDLCQIPAQGAFALLGVSLPIVLNVRVGSRDMQQEQSQAVNYDGADDKCSSHE